MAGREKDSDSQTDTVKSDLSKEAGDFKKEDADVANAYGKQAGDRIQLDSGQEYVRIRTKWWQIWYVCGFQYTVHALNNGYTGFQALPLSQYANLSKMRRYLPLFNF